MLLLSQAMIQNLQSYDGATESKKHALFDKISKEIKEQHDKLDKLDKLENSDLRKNLDARNALVSLNIVDRLERLAPVFSVAEVEEVARKYAPILPPMKPRPGLRVGVPTRLAQEEEIQDAIFETWREYLEHESSLTIKEFVAEWPNIELSPVDSVVQFYFNRILKKEVLLSL